MLCFIFELEDHLVPGSFQKCYTDTGSLNLVNPRDKYRFIFKIAFFMHLLQQTSMNALNLTEHHHGKTSKENGFQKTQLSRKRHLGIF
jgi:hypothetical protein